MSYRIMLWAHEEELDSLSVHVAVLNSGKLFIIVT